MSMIEVRKRERINLVLNTIKANPDSSKTEIKKLSGLSMEMVLQYIDYLTQEGLIYCSNEVIEESVKVGRPAERYRLNPKGGKFLGIKFTARRVSGVITDFCGNLLATYETEKENISIEPAELLERIYQCIERLGESFPLSELTAIGIAAPGFVNSKTGQLLRYSRLKSDEPLDLKSIIEQKYGVLTYVDGTTKAKAIAYHLNAGKNLENFVYIYIGTGCSLAYIYKDNLFRGSNNLDGELGHLPVFGKNTVCSCGKKGCLETVIGNRYILKTMQERGCKDCLSIDRFVSLAEEGEPIAVEILADVAKNMAYALSTVIILYDSEYIILCGDYVMLPQFQQDLNRWLSELCLKELLAHTEIHFVKNKQSDNAIDAALLGYYNIYYNKTLI